MATEREKQLHVRYVQAQERVHRMEKLLEESRVLVEDATTAIAQLQEENAELKRQLEAALKPPPAEKKPRRRRTTKTETPKEEADDVVD